MPPLRVLFQDARAIAVSKPPGLLTVAPPKHQSKGEATLVDWLRNDGFAALPVHRLDRDTSGVVLCAKDASTKSELMDVFRGRGVRKVYIGVVQGEPEPPEGLINFRIKDLGARGVVSPAGQPAETRYRVIERFQGASMLELELLTGRHNQARLHLAHIGHPLVGERTFAFRRDAVFRHKRCALHAARLSLRLPWEVEERTIEAPLPVDLENLLRKLRDLE